MPINNVVLIVVDALRRDRVGAYSDDNLTPNIDSLAENGEVFDHCYSCINATDASLTTIFTGLYPTHHGVTNHGNNITEEEKRYVSSTTSIPEIINETHGTYGIDTLKRWHERGFGNYLNPRRVERNSVTNKVADRMNQLPSLVKDPLKKIYKSYSGNTQLTESEMITNQALEILETENPPFFLFLHYWDTHIPYLPTEHHSQFIRQRSYDDERSLDEVLSQIEGSQWCQRLKDGLIGDSTKVSDMKRKYDAGVWEVDRSIGRIINALKEEGLYEKTAVMITSDHGESFTEHGVIFDHHGLYDPTVHVPLIIRAPGFKGREDQFIQHFDLAPTIINLLDIDYPTAQFDGVSLTKKDGERELGRDAIFVEEGHTARKRAVRTKNHKYIKRLDDQSVCRYCEIRHAPARELYDLEEDPDEENNVVGENPELGKDLDDKLQSWINHLPGPTKEEVSFEPSEEVKDRLEEMGYL